MQLVDEGVIKLDTPIERYLPKALPEYTEPEVEDRYARWSDLAGDEAVAKADAEDIAHPQSGLCKFCVSGTGWPAPLSFSRAFAYDSGDGYILLQFVLERGLGLDLGKEMQRRVFDRFGMRNTSMIWRPDFRRNFADGWDLQGKVGTHDERSTVRASLMDTTIKDFASGSPPASSAARGYPRQAAPR